MPVAEDFKKITRERHSRELADTKNREMILYHIPSEKAIPAVQAPADAAFSDGETGPSSYQPFGITNLGETKFKPQKRH
jgi:hypothetical protein